MPTSWKPSIGLVVSLLDELRTSFWFIPVVMAVGAAALALGIVQLDGTLDTKWKDSLPWVLHTEAAGTRAILSTIAGSMITVTGVVFSITLVALTLASSQFGPRLLRNFLDDRGNQLVLGTFVATFLYSLLVLSTVRTDAVPTIGTSLAVLMAVWSLFVLIYFVHHVTRSIQASTIIDAVGREIEQQIPKLFPVSIGSEQPDVSNEDRARVLELDASGVDVLASKVGYIRVIDDQALMDCANEHDLLLQLTRRPGDFVGPNLPVARMLAGTEVGDEVHQEVACAFIVGAQRSPVQDTDFLFGQITEMAIRALSPGINDPRTAIACTERLGAALASIANRDAPAAERMSDEGRLRVLAAPRAFGDLVRTTLGSIWRHARGDVDVARAVLEALQTTGRACADPRRLEPLSEFADVVRDSTNRGATTAADLAMVDTAWERARAALSDGPPRSA